MATPAIVADTAPPEVRGRELLIVSMAALLPCLAIVLRLRGTRPGHYAHTASF